MEFNLYIWFICAAVSLGISLVFKYKGQINWSLFWLTIGGLCVYLFATQLCPFLNLWDEQYHAVVAKNCMEHPFCPMFYQDAEVPGIDYSNWTSAHIWLHKQPLFLWFIAFSFKVFGVSLFALRLPSAIMCTLMIPLGYRIAKLLTQDNNTAYYTALAIACSWYLILLTSGIASTDHNDVCFIFNITASLWAFVEYEHSDKHPYLWAIMIGLFTGAALLSKWLPGLLVFFCWGIYLLTEKGFNLKQWNLTHILVALGIATLIFLPWQLYILHQFPETAQQELFFNIKHFNQEIEQHNGPALYFLQILPFQYSGRGFEQNRTGFQWNIYTIFTYCILLIGLFLLIKSMKKRSHRITTLSCLLFVYLFYSIAKTKMPTFTFMICIIWFMSIGSLISWIIEQVKKWIHQPILQTIISTALIFGTAFYQINFPHYQEVLWSGIIDLQIHNREVYESWREKTPEDCHIFNVNGANNCFSYVLNSAAIFFSDRECYAELPDYETLKTLQNKGMKVAIVDMPGIAEEYLTDSTFIHLEPEVIGF